MSISCTKHRIEKLPLETKIQWLRLLRCENIGPITFYHLLNRYKSAQEALRHLPEMTRRAPHNAPLVVPSLDAITQEIEAYNKIGALLIAQPEALYPASLRALPDAPPLISVLGRVDLLSRPSFSIVGARNASAIGCQLAYEFANTLSRAGLVITSGLARGIDTQAHQGAVNEGTVAVLPGGIDQKYPQENKKLYHRLSQDGLLLSEVPIGTQPHSRLFTRRNRLISGLSLGVLIVEATLKSGSLVTARYAAEQGRDVFAIPGNPCDPRAHGTNHLIKQGAILTQTPEDILAEYQHARLRDYAEKAPAADSVTLPAFEHDQNQEDLNDLCQKLKSLLGAVPTTIDTLAVACQAPISAVRAALVEIEIAGYVERHAGDKVSLASTPPHLFRRGC